MILVKMAELSQRQSRSAGFSLVEIMVAAVIGLLGILVMMQMFSLFEGQRRTTTAGDDAISSGAVSLGGLQRNIEQSGWGINSDHLIGCTATGAWGTGPALALPLAPALINPVIAGTAITGDANTDTLMVVSGNGNGSVEGDSIGSGAAGATLYGITATSAFAAGDRVIATPATRAALCNLVLTSIASVSTPPAATVTVAAAAAGAVSGGVLFNMGVAPSVLVYAIRNQILTVCDYTSNDCAAGGTWTPVANNIVSLRAQYGRDSTPAVMDGIVDVWDQTTPASMCGFVRVPAVRLVLVARSSEPEKPLSGNPVTSAAPTWAGSAGVAIDLTDPSLSPGGASWPTWQDFRYKTFETVVPLRNVTTMGRVPGC